MDNPSRTEWGLIDRSLLLDVDSPNIHPATKSDRRLRNKVLIKFGNKCDKCGTSKKLQLHHRYYAKDSIRAKIHREPGNQSRKRNYEALAHPERFRMLCLSCHNSIDPKRKSPVNIGKLFDG